GFRSARRGGLWAPRPQRRRQVDDLPDALRAPHPDERGCERRGGEPGARREPRARAPGVHGAEVLALWRSLGRAEPRLLRRHLRTDAFCLALVRASVVVLIGVSLAP